MYVLSFPGSCPPLDPPDNGSITQCSGTSVGDICLLECDPGFELSGDDVRTCQSDQTWSGTDTVCTPGTYVCHIYILNVMKF